MRSVSASTPGSFSPARNSSDAPPPVEMCEICLATPDCSTAATESPPPMIEVAPAVVAAATAWRSPACPARTRAFRTCPAARSRRWCAPWKFPALNSSIVLRADVEAHPAVGRVVDVGDFRRGRIRRFGEHVVDRQQQPEIALLRFLEQVAREIELVVFDQRFPDRQPLRLQKRVGHGAADEHRVGKLHQVLHDFDFVGNFRAAEHRHKRALGIRDGFAEIGELLFHQQARRRPGGRIS